MRSTEDLTTTARIRDAAIDQFGQHGFGVSVRTIATAAGVSPGLVIHHFGSKDGLRKACDDYVAAAIADAKTESVQSTDPAQWFTALDEVESFAPHMAYLARTLQGGGELAKTLWRRMIDNAEQYLAEGVRAGTIKGSRDPRARAQYLAIAGGGGFLLYLQMHDTPHDLRAVLRDYTRDMVVPALEVYTQGVLADATMYDAFVAHHRAAEPVAATNHDGSDIP